MISAERYVSLKKGDSLFAINKTGYDPQKQVFETFLMKVVVDSKRQGVAKFLCEVISDDENLKKNHCYYAPVIIGTCGLYETEAEALLEMKEYLLKLKEDFKTIGGNQTQYFHNKISDCRNSIEKYTEELGKALAQDDEAIYQIDKILASGRF